MTWNQSLRQTGVELDGDRGRHLIEPLQLSHFRVDFMHTGCFRGYCFQRLRLAHMLTAFFFFHIFTMSQQKYFSFSLYVKKDVQLTRMDTEGYRWCNLPISWPASSAMSLRRRSWKWKETAEDLWIIHEGTGRMCRVPRVVHWTKMMEATIVPRFDVRELPGRCQFIRFVGRRGILFPQPIEPSCERT